MFKARTLVTYVGVSLALAGVIFYGSWSNAHARMVTPKPRSAADGLKVGPCGNVLRTNTPTKLQAGQAVAVQWEETINHPGFFVWDISYASDANFQVLASITDNQNNGNLPHAYNGTITIPQQACTDCTLRLRQFMSENPVAPTLYYSCADITVEAAAGGGVTVPTPPPPPPPPVTPPGTGTAQGAGSSLKTNTGAQMAGCSSAAVVAHGSSGGGAGKGPWSSTGLLVVISLPMLILHYLRLRRPRRHFA